MLRQKASIVPLVAASVSRRERDAGKRLLRPRKRGADEGRVDAARHRHSHGSKLVGPRAHDTDRHVTKLRSRFIIGGRWSARQELLRAPDREFFGIASSRIGQGTGPKLVDTDEAGLSRAQFSTHRKASQRIPRYTHPLAAGLLEKFRIRGEHHMGCCHQAVDRNQSGRIRQYSQIATVLIGQNCDIGTPEVRGEVGGEAFRRASTHLWQLRNAMRGVPGEERADHTSGRAKVRDTRVSRCPEPRDIAAQILQAWHRLQPSRRPRSEARQCESKAQCGHTTSIGVYRSTSSAVSLSTASPCWTQQ